MTKYISHSILRVLALAVLLTIIPSIIPKSAAAATAVVGLGCRASANGGNLTIPISSTVGEGDTILIAVQVVARNEDLVGITDAAGNTYTRLVKHLGIVIGPVGLEENDTHHVYAAFDAHALNGGQTITVGWGFSNILEACAVKVSGLYQSPFDQSASAHTNNTTPDSGNTVTTSLADEVLIGTFGWFCFPNSPCNADATAGAGYTEAIEGQDVMIEHRLVNTVGAYNATATLSASSDWNAAIVTFKVDTTPPVITPQVSGPVGQNGWYTGDVVVSWTATDPESRVISTCSPTTISADTAGVQVTCNATSAGGTSTQSITVKRDATPPTITATAAPAPNGNGWNNSDVTVSFTCADALSGLVGACPANQVLSTEGSSVNSTPQTISDQAGNSASSNVITVKIDKTAPDVSVIGVSDGASYTLGSVPTAACDTSDATSGVATQATLSVTGGNPDGTGSFTATCSGAIDNADNSAAPTSVNYTVNPLPDTTAPVITPQVNGTLGNSGWYVSDVTVSWSVVDDESAISSQSGCETQNVTGDTAGVTFTCSATSAGGSSSESVTIKRDATTPIVTVTGVSDGATYTLGSVPTAACDTSDATSGVATQATLSVTGGNPDGTGSFTATCSPATDVAGNSAAPVSVSYTVSAPVDACTTTALRDDFNRANGSLGSNWAGLTSQSFYKVANNQVDVQLGGPVVWKPTTFGVNQAAFVTLSTLDANSPSQGVLLKVQSGTIPNAGAIIVVYDSRAKAVRVSTLRLNRLTWTTYGNTAVTFVNGDKLGGCVKADGTVRVYQNDRLLTTVTLNAADQSFFNAKGGKIGLWTVAAPNAFLDDFGGGALTGVTGATLDANAVPDEVADDGAEITVAADFPTDDTAIVPDAGTFTNRVFLPLVTR